MARKRYKPEEIVAKLRQVVEALAERWSRAVKLVGPPSEVRPLS
jgi:hypothetical protein